MTTQAPQYAIRTPGQQGAEIAQEIQNLYSAQKENMAAKIENVIALDEIGSQILTVMNSNNDLNRYDLFTKEREIEIVLANVPDEELAHGIFDALIVDDIIPFAKFNTGEVKLEHVKGKKSKIPQESRYKIYHTTDNFMHHKEFIPTWKMADSLNRPNRLFIKLLIPPENGKVTIHSYVDIVFKFGVGMVAILKRDKSNMNPQDVINLLQSRLFGVKISLGKVVRTHTSFVVSNLTIDNALFRDILISKHQFGQGKPLFLYPFIWVKEKDKALYVRSQFKLNVRIGNITAKVIISEKESKLNDLFYVNGRINTFKEGSNYTLITITGVEHAQQAAVVRDLVSMVFYIYGSPMFGNSNSLAIANYYNGIIGVEGYFRGSLFDKTSKVMTMEDYSRVANKNAALKLIDPTFYMTIATGKKSAEQGKQPRLVATVTDPNWQNHLIAALNLIASDPPDKKRQIIRYPFLLVDGSGVPLKEADQPKTITPPYFLMTEQKHYMFKLKPIDDPRGLSGTRHPWLPTNSMDKASRDTLSITTPGADNLQVLYQALIDLMKPFTVVAQDRNVRTGNYENKSSRILREGISGTLNFQLTTVLRSKFIKGDIEDVTFRRIGYRKSNDSLLRIINDVRSSVSKTEYIEAAMRQRIADSVDWNVCRQELFDIEPQTAKANFLDLNQEIDSQLYRTILESYFGIYLLVIRFNRETIQQSVEIPRHKFIHISRSYKPDTPIVMIFKHVNIDKSINAAHYELITPLFTMKGGVVPTMNYLTVAEELFDSMNSTIEVSFATVKRIQTNNDRYETGTIVKTRSNKKPMLNEIFDAKLQFIDGAGKLRAFVVNNITIACEPLVPLSIASFDDPAVFKVNETKNYLKPQNAEIVMNFIRSLNISSEDLAFRRLQQEIITLEEVVVDKLAELRKETEAPKIEPVAETNSGGGDAFDFASAIERARLKNLIKEEKVVDQQKSERRIIKSRDNENSNRNLANGVWFKYRGVQFYVAITPYDIPPNSSINNLALFEIDPKLIIFRQFDYYERVANIMIQLVRNLYLYSRSDDPRNFLNFMTVVQPEVVYQINGVQRQFSAYRNFTDDLKEYSRLYPTFFTHPTDGSLSKMILDSRAVFDRLLGQLKLVQRIKEDIVGATGSKLRVYNDNGIRRVEYIQREINASFFPPTNVLTDHMIRTIVRMDVFYNRPAYIIEFYKYPSDYTVRSPGQKIFMSTEEITQYFELLDMENTGTVLRTPLNPLIFNEKRPQYFSTGDGSLYLLQTVNSNTYLRVLTVLKKWDSDRINSGYFADEWQYRETMYTINITDIDRIDPSRNLIVLEFKNGSYCALMKISGSISFN